MKTFTRNKLLIGMVALLLIMNLAMAVTIYIHVSKEKTGKANSTSSTYLCKQLRFNPTQLSGYENQRETFFKYTDSLRSELSKLRQLLANEIEKETPDTAVLNQLSAKTGQLYSQLTLETALHFYEMGKLCTTEQKTKLFETYRTTGIKDQESKGGGKQWRHRHGQGKNR